MAITTLLDIAKLNGTDQLAGLIEENLTYAPELNFFPTRAIAGTSYDTVVRTSFPSVGFRQANAGNAISKSVTRRDRVQCFIFGGAIQVDKAVAQAYDQGSAAWEMIESSGFMKAALIALGSQIWYGTTSDASGFPGIKAAIAKTATTALDVAGSTATTASSVYGVKFGAQDVIMPMGNNAQLSLSEFRDQQITLDSASTWLPGRVADLCGWVGLQLGNANCVGRICNLTAETNKTLTDAKIAQWLSQFPVGYQPDRIFMSRRSAYQLQSSRTVVLNGGATGKVNGASEAVAPSPIEAFGIPITVTDSIGITDAIE